MLISRNWLQTFFEQTLPSAVDIADALTFHVFEIDGIEKNGDDDILDVKITANRGHDCLSHRGIAGELSAILKMPMKRDPFRALPDLSPNTDALHVFIEDKELCSRYIAGVLHGVKVGPSPEWLKKLLEAVGQRSINNIVDAANYVMLDIGQPLHAFDDDKVVGGITVRHIMPGESLDLLKTTKEIKGGAIANLSRKIVQSPEGGPGFLAIADNSGPIALAGVKGGIESAVTESTTSLILESACFDGVAIRTAGRSMNLRTDASSRFEHGLSPELAGYSMRALADLIVQIAGGEIVGFVDAYPRPQEKVSVSVSLPKINAVLGTELHQADVAEVFSRLGFSFEQDNEMFTVSVPFGRLDITIPEDLIEEVARIIGYEEINSATLPPMPSVHSPKINRDFYMSEKVRNELMSRGYSEVFTSVFADRGERAVANKADSARPYMRDTLIDGLSEALKKNIVNKALLGLSEIKLFEIGIVWRDGKEVSTVGIASEKEKVSERPLEEYMTGEGEPSSYEHLHLSTATRYKSFSKYPFIVRDVAVWVPSGTDAESVLEITRVSAGNLLVNISQFDRFEKNDRISLAYRLVFQSFYRTLEDKDANDAMDAVYYALRAQGFEIR